MRIFSISGYPGHGKDTIADQFGGTGLRVATLAFGEPIYRMCEDINPIIYTGHYPSHLELNDIIENIGWDEAKRLYPPIRRLLQDLGQGARRRLGDDVFTRVLRNRLIDARNFSDIIIVPDTRQPNEFELLQRERATFIKVVRPDYNRENQSHSHETEQWERHIPPHVTVLNNGTIPELKKIVAQIYNAGADFSGMTFCSKSQIAYKSPQ